MIQRIVINFPTNLGDVILALPVLDRLKVYYPEAKISAIVSVKTREFLLRNSFINEVILFDKSWTLAQKRRFASSLRGKFDLVVDLKNSFLPAVLGAKFRTPFIRFFSKNMHITDKYQSLIRKFTSSNTKAGSRKYAGREFNTQGSNKKSDFILSDEEMKKWEDLKLSSSVFICCSSRSRVKFYPHEYLKKVVDALKVRFNLVILGVSQDRAYYKDILSSDSILDLVGKTRMSDIFYLLKNYGRLLIGVDSSVVHLASYLNIPVVSIFGPTHPGRSYPRSDNSIVLTNKAARCAPCEKPKCMFDHECMKISPEIVIAAVTQAIKKSELGKQ